MNCPQCRGGVLEKVGTFIFQNNIIMFDHNFYGPKEDKGIELFICSLECCGHTKMIAIPGTLSKLKSERRELNKEKRNVVAAPQETYK